MCFCCGVFVSAVDGGWGDWESISTCSQTCGSGLLIQRRDCDSPSPAHGGNYCRGPHQIVNVCNKEECPGTCTDVNIILCFCNEGMINCHSGTSRQLELHKLSKYREGRSMSPSPPLSGHLLHCRSMSPLPTSFRAFATYRSMSPLPTSFRAFATYRSMSPLPTSFRAFATYRSMSPLPTSFRAFATCRSMSPLPTSFHYIVARYTCMWLQIWNGE